MSKAAVCLLLALSIHGCKHREENDTEASSAKVEPEFSTSVGCGKTATSFYAKVARAPGKDYETIYATCSALVPILVISCGAGEGGYFVMYSALEFKGGMTGPYKDRELCQAIRNSIYLKFQTAAAAAPAAP